MLVLNTAPTIEPIDLAALKLHLKLDSGSFADNVTEYQTLVPDNYAVAADYTTHVGTGIDVLGKTAIVILNSGTNGASGTVDAKIQESDDDVTYTDWTTGAFTQVTEANDNAIQEKAYTGIKQYIRVVAKVLVAACDFGVTVVTLDPTSAEDDLLEAIIQAAREHVEDYTRRALLTQTWYYYLDEWPSINYIKMPLGNLQTTNLAVKWKDTDGSETTLTLNTDYLIETNDEKCGRIVLPYGETWPSETLYPSNPIKIEFQCGWTAAASIPEIIRTAVKITCSDLYHNREQFMSGTIVNNRLVEKLLFSWRLWDEF